MNIYTYYILFFLQGPAFSKFWMFVLILKTVEQLCEALPQVIINSLAFYQRYKLCRRLNFIIRVCIFIPSKLTKFSGHLYCPLYWLCSPVPCHERGQVLLLLPRLPSWAFEVSFWLGLKEQPNSYRSRDEEVETIVNENTQEALLPASNSHSTSDNRTDKRKRNIYVQRSSSHPPQAG